MGNGKIFVIHPLVKKLKGIKRQEFSDAVGINLQSLSKIERGVNYPTIEKFTFELSEFVTKKNVIYFPYRRLTRARTP
ncbi:MAG: helix-turn-helix transcriptional regulator [Lachnospiraceae bacterium]|nr:helix-turn-helix transcriptional regulator [Lachnospiraceae bacterium]